MIADVRPRVLIVEDEPLVREIAVAEFVDAGFEVVTAADGDAALEVLSGNAAFDLLFTDIRMPGNIDGWSVAAAARRGAPRMAVIYVTGFSEDQSAMVERAVLLKKPYRFSAILQAANDLGVLPGGESRIN